MNLGLGLSVRGGPINIYFITDQAPTAYFWPQEISSLNFRFGFNLVFGCDPSGNKKRPTVDRLDFHGLFKKNHLLCEDYPSF